MSQQGWTEGQSLGSSQTGLVDALGNDGQKPSDKRGLGYVTASHIITTFNLLYNVL